MYYFIGAELFLQPQPVLKTEEAVLYNMLHAQLFFQPQRKTHMEPVGGGFIVKQNTDISYGKIIIIIIIIIITIVINNRTSYLVIMLVI